ncbi:acyltransferase family protein [Sphingomonas sp.]|uniref:acyltransferase family protein n=1 Tax=Sphingomonas sp. TaxID=28214 RepID=UPI0017A20538|nr:acyltransferase family protein [Sphingomonas sp.]MBA4762101.1 acyltransferase [Sphingomonas sp.]
MGAVDQTDGGGDPQARDCGVETRASGAFIVMDALRCVLAVTVAFAHAWYLLIADYPGQASTIASAGYFLAGFAHASVILFFVLSGYWIAKSVDRRMTAGWVWTGYTIDRLARLLVVLLPALAIGGILDAIGLYGLESSTHTGATDTYVLNNNLAERLGWQTLLGNILFLQSIAVAPFGTNGPLWSLAYEFWFYIWFPALWVSWRSRRPSPLLATLLLAWIVPNMLVGFACWLCGAALFWVTRRSGGQSLQPLRRLWLIVASVPFLGTLIYSRLFGLGDVELPLAFTFAVLLYALLRVELRAPRWLRPFAGYGAQASFSLYILHFPVIAFAAALLLDDKRLPATGASVMLVVVVLVVAILLSALFARYTERHTARVRAFFSNGRPARI